MWWLAIAIAAGAGYIITSYAGTKYLEDCHKLAKEIMDKKLGDKKLGE